MVTGRLAYLEIPHDRIRAAMGQDSFADTEVVEDFDGARLQSLSL
jgi:hypothetical protein